MQRTHTRIFTASEVAEFAYCPLAWWHEQFEPWAQANNEELFARLVELEHEHSSQAPALPEYRMIEQLLLRRGAFDEGRSQDEEYAEAAEESAEVAEAASQQDVHATARVRLFTRATIVFGVLALLCLLGALFWH